MPFILALSAQTRHKMFQEIKKQGNDRIDIDSLIELKEQQIPQAQAKFLNKGKNSCENYI